MPKRSQRSEFLKRMKGGNPFDGRDAHEMYRELRWGNNPNEAWTIDAPEDMATIGELARMDFDDGSRENYRENEAPFLAVGRESNLLYVVPQQRGNPVDVADLDDGYQFIGNVKRTDYYSDKGGQPALYYHKHERPYPEVYENAQGCRVVIPANWQGGPSYVVSEEGIIG
jgi:hypothetical protein